MSKDIASLFSSLIADLRHEFFGVQDSPNARLDQQTWICNWLLKENYTINYSLYVVADPEFSWRIKDLLLGIWSGKYFIREPDYQSDIRAFQKKFGHESLKTPGFLDPASAEFRKKFLQEEVDEFNEAVEQGDIFKAAHELCDVLYIAFGTADNMGIPIGECWKEVQRANMDKMRATSAEQSKRGSTLDVVKPPGWKRADVKRVLLNYAPELDHGQ